jgi:oligopeptide transport system permease protein
VFWASLTLIAILIVMAAFPGLFTSADPASCQATRARVSPSSSAWFGYDVQGCDVYARTIYGARASIVVGSIATFAAMVIGAGVGIYAGFFGGIVDTLLSRVTDIFFAIPILLGSIIILTSIPTPSGSAFFSIIKVSLVIAALGWTSTARVARSSVIQVKQADFVSASRALGASRTWMIRKHIIPNAAAPVIVITTISLGSYIGAEATLSYLGIGLQSPVISWGIAISDAAAYVRSTPHMLFFPATFLSLTVLAFISLGDVVREALDPKAM